MTLIWDESSITYNPVIPLTGHWPVWCNLNCRWSVIHSALISRIALQSTNPNLTRDWLEGCIVFGLTKTNVIGVIVYSMTQQNCFIRTTSSIHIVLAILLSWGLLWMLTRTSMVKEKRLISCIWHMTSNFFFLTILWGYTILKQTGSGGVPTVLLDYQCSQKFKSKAKYGLYRTQNDQS